MSQKKGAEEKDFLNSVLAAELNKRLCLRHSCSSAAATAAAVADAAASSVLIKRHMRHWHALKSKGKWRQEEGG